MRLALPVAALVAALSCGRAASAQEYGSVDRPPTGSDYVATGVALSAIGTLALGGAPLCNTKIVPTTNRTECFAASFLTGVPILALGMPFVVVGAVQHARYRDWARQHPTIAGLSLGPAAGGGLVTFRAAF